VRHISYNLERMRLPMRCSSASPAWAQSICRSEAAPLRLRSGIIEIVCGDDRCSALVVPGVHTIPRCRAPNRRLARAKIVQNQNLDRSNRLEDFHLRGFACRVVAGLNFLQQFAVIAKQSRMSAMNQFFQCATARCVFPTPEGPMNSSPFSERTGYSRTNPCVNSFACFSDCACCAVQVFPSVRSVT